MKAEDVKLLWRIASLEACGVESGYDPPEELMLRFARACEQRGIERAKSKLIWETRHSESFGIPYAAPDWSALDAEIEKENEGG